jgi:predicted MFS family arabinose efflux permease
MLSAGQEFRIYWRPLGAAFVAVTLGVMSVPFYILGPMIKPLEAAFGWSQLDLLICSSLMAIGVTITAPAIGWLADRVEARRLVATSLVLLAGCYAAAASMRGPVWEVQLIWFLTGFLGCGSSGVVITRAIGARFVKARGLALGITLCGTGVASFAAPLFAHTLVEAAGWRSVFWVLTALSLIVALPITWLGLGTTRAPDRSAAEPARPVYGATLHEAIRDPRFWMLLATIIMFGLPISSTILNMVPMLIDRDVEPARAAQIASVMGIMIVIGRLLIGWLLDRTRPSFVGIGIFALAAIGAIAILAGGVDYALLTVIALGFMLGAEIDLMSFITLRYFGTRAYGVIFAIFFGAYTAISIVGPYAGGKLIALSHGYDIIYQVASASWSAATLLFVILSRMSDEKPLLPDAAAH